MVSSMWPTKLCYLSLIYIDLSNLFNSFRFCKQIFFQRIGDLLEQGQIIFGNVENIDLENSTNLWKYDI